MKKKILLLLITLLFFASFAVSSTDINFADNIQTTFTELNEHRSGCTIENADSTFCNAASKRLCQAKGYESGFGPIEYTTDKAYVTCVTLEAADNIQTSFTELNEQRNGCTIENADSTFCNAASKRLCQAKGYESGFGPIEYGEDTAYVTCVTSEAADNTPTTFEELNTHHSSCTIDEVTSASCNAAVKRLCQAKGYESGFGPIEYTGDPAHVTCLISKIGTCFEQGCNTCSSDETCDGEWITASDTERCCSGDCELFYRPSISTSVDGLVNHIFECILERSPNDNQLTNWRLQLGSGRVPVEDAYKTFFGVGEYIAKDTTNDKYITQMYSCVLFRDPDLPGKSEWVGRLDSGSQSREEVLDEFLESDEFLNLVLPKLHDLILAPSAGQYIDSGFDPELTTTFSSSDKILMVHYFYWYDKFSDLHIVNPDGSDALTDHPSTYPDYTNPDFSYKSVEWWEKEIRDISTAGIDVVLLVYWGFPHSDHSSNEWSNGGLSKLAEAMNNLEKEGVRLPKLGMCYDTHTIEGNPLRHLDLTKPSDRLYFWGTIRDFWSQIPPKYWAQINGKPVTYIWNSAYAKDYNQEAFNYLREKFKEHFAGKDPYILRHPTWNVETEATAGWLAALNGPQIFDTVQIGPGFDNSAVQGLELRIRSRENGEFYSSSWETAIDSGLNIILLETWSEFHEGTDIADSYEYGTQYITLTKEFNDQWRGIKRKIGPPKILIEEEYCEPEWECRLEPAECPPEGIQNKVCYDVKCGAEEERVEAIECELGSCAGCLTEGICYPIMSRMIKDGTPSYCDITKKIAKQKDLEAPCQNNYECLTNECSSGKCIDIKKELEETRSLLKKILEWLKRIF